MSNLLFSLTCTVRLSFRLRMSFKRQVVQNNRMILTIRTKFFAQQVPNVSSCGRKAMQKRACYKENVFLKIQKTDSS